MRRRSAAALAALALLVAACGPPDTDPGAAQGGAPADGGAPGEGGAPAEGGATPGTDAPFDGDGATNGDVPPADEPSAAGDVPGATARPDPDEVSHPCAEHDDRGNEAFIEVASPVPGQQVGDAVDLVGCSNVPEAAVQWRLVDGDGTPLRSGVTTAACGSGCVGAFRDSVDLSVAADADGVELHVFWDDVATAGGERGLHEIPLDLG